MTADEIDRLTIAEVRAIAERASEALAKLQEVQALLGGAGSVTAVTPSPRHVAAPPQLRPDEMARREALLAQNRADVLPDDIKRAEGIQ